MAAKKAASTVADVIEHLTAFVEKVKDDPTLSEIFRVAANELHAKLTGSDVPTEPTEG